MPGRVNPIVPGAMAIVVGAILVGVLAVVGADSRALAGSECIEQPGREPTQGAHWYYHYDRGQNRKCWYLATSPTKPHETAPPQEPKDGAAAPTIDSVLTSLFKGWPQPAPVAPQPQDATAGEPRIIQSNPTKPLRLEDIAQPQTDIPEERAEPRYTTPLNSAQRRALFQDYLRWEEIQRTMGDVGASGRTR